ncbi:MAG: hypothetical protein ACOCRX_08250 [Candidatus Woesearchaeota archaeon]
MRDDVKMIILYGFNFIKNIDTKTLSNKKIKKVIKKTIREINE